MEMLNGLPKWARTLTSMSAVSVLVLMAIYLFVLVVGEVRANSSSTRQMLKDHIDTTERTSDRIISLIEDMRSESATNSARVIDLMRVQNRLLRQQCVNGATDYLQRQACLAIGEGQ